MRASWLLVLAACGSPKAATPSVRRVVIEPEGGSRQDARRCGERCAPHTRPGEQAKCEGVSLDRELGDTVGYSTAVVCVIGPATDR